MQRKQIHGAYGSGIPLAVLKVVDVCPIITRVESIFQCCTHDIRTDGYGFRGLFYKVFSGLILRSKLCKFRQQFIDFTHAL